jgi:hypothetical protein
MNSQVMERSNLFTGSRLANLGVEEEAISSESETTIIKVVV